MAVLPQVMLFGDSIRLGYQPLVAEPDVVHWTNGIHDKIVRERMAEYTADNHLHLSDAGTQACGVAVARAVETFLPANN